jgi:hypothetical protein
MKRFNDTILNGRTALWRPMTKKIFPQFNPRRKGKRSGANMRYAAGVYINLVLHRFFDPFKKSQSCYSMQSYQKLVKGKKGNNNVYKRYPT